MKKSLAVLLPFLLLSFAAMAEKYPFVRVTRVDSCYTFVKDSATGKLSKYTIAPEEYDENGAIVYSVEKPEVPLDLDIDTTPKKKKQALRCSKIENFKELVKKPYIYDGIWAVCDVNKDGLADYLIITRGTDKNAWEPHQYEENTLVDRNRRGFVLVINKGGYFETDIKNESCFLSENEDGGNYIAPELSVFANKDTLEIHYGHGRYGYWGYKFVYKNGNYEMIEMYSSSNRGPITSFFKSINFEKNTMRTVILKGDASDYEAEPDDDGFVYTYYTIKKDGPILITDILELF